MKTLHFVSGGLGKNICFTSIISKLAEKYNDKISIVSGYPEVFKDNDNVESVFYFPEYLNFKKKDNFNKFSKYEKIFNNDPYYSSYIFDDKHIIETYCDMYDIKYNHDMPTIDIKQNSKIVFNNFRKNIKNKYFIFQFSGGQPRTGHNYDINSLFSFRNVDYQLSKEFLSVFQNKYPDVTIIFFNYSNEYTYNLSNSLVYNNNFIYIQEILKNSLGFLSIDSSLQHLAATEEINKKGVVLFNNNCTVPDKIGHDTHKNLCFNDWNHIRFDMDYMIDIIDAEFFS